MRTSSPRLAVPLVALAFLTGWMTASWVSPPTAVTQEQAVRATSPPPLEPSIPRVALDAVTAPRTTPLAARNPFMFGHAARVAEGGVAVERRVEPVRPADPSMAVESPAEAAARWRVIGIAASDDGRFTAVLSGAGEVLLLGAGDRLPDGATVIDVALTYIVVEGADGRRDTLRLP